MTFVFVAAFVFSTLIMEKHLQNILKLFHQCSTDAGANDKQLNEAVIYHQKIRNFNSYYDSSMRDIFTLFFVLQLIIMVVIILALSTVKGFILLN